jgi:adenosylhomocysteine nucleosidase
MKLGIMGAMPEEVSGIRAELTDPETRHIAGRDYVSGHWHGLEVVVVFSHWGKVAAAATSAMLLSEFAVDGIVFIGVAGGADPGLELGDVVVASELLQYDMDASPLGFDRFAIPLLGRARFAAHPPWVTLAQSTSTAFMDREFATSVSAELRNRFALSTPRVVTGLIASGDRFVSDPAFLAALRDTLPDLRCVEMEGGAVAQVCFEFGKPVAVLRVISDRADHAAPIDFPRFVAGVASVMTTHIASRFVAALATQPAQP